jgi:hypothetical protein
MPILSNKNRYVHTVQQYKHSRVSDPGQNEETHGEKLIPEYPGIRNTTTIDDSGNIKSSLGLIPSAVSHVPRWDILGTVRETLLVVGQSHFSSTFG